MLPTAQLPNPMDTKIQSQLIKNAMHINSALQAANHQIQQLRDAWQLVPILQSIVEPIRHMRMMELALRSALMAIGEILEQQYVGQLVWHHQHTNIWITQLVRIFVWAFVQLPTVFSTQPTIIVSRFAQIIFLGMLTGLAKLNVFLQIGVLNHTIKNA